MIREIRLLRQFDHDNIIRIVDMLPPPSVEKFKDVYMVLDRMDTVGNTAVGLRAGLGLKRHGCGFKGWKPCVLISASKTRLPLRTVLYHLLAGVFPPINEDRFTITGHEWTRQVTQRCNTAQHTHTPKTGSDGRVSCSCFGLFFHLYLWYVKTAHRITMHTTLGRWQVAPE